jgi:tight adherence protein B
MPFEIDPIYLVYLLVAVSAGFLVEGIYLLFFSGASYRKTVNRRLKLLRNEPNRENILVQLRKERGLTSTGNYRLALEALNRLVLQSG